MNKDLKIDNSAFNSEYYKGKTEEQFIKDQLASVPDSYGDNDQKIEFLKSAFAKINPPSEKKPAKA